MLRFLVIFLLLSNEGMAQIPQFKDPSGIEVNQQRSKAIDALSNADTLLNKGTVGDILKEEQIKIQGVNFNNSSFHFPEFIKKGQMNQYLSEAISAGEKINNSKIQEIEGSILVFVSFSMPQGELKQLISEANQLKASVVLRGVDKDFISTIKKIKEIVGDQNGVLIDPFLFKRFDVQTVPTFILPLESLEKCTLDSCRSIKYVKAQGSVSLRYFLELIERTSEGKEKEVIKNFLTKRTEK